MLFLFCTLYGKSTEFCDNYKIFDPSQGDASSLIYIHCDLSKNAGWWGPETFSPIIVHRYIRDFVVNGEPINFKQTCKYPGCEERQTISSVKFENYFILDGKIWTLENDVLKSVYTSKQPDSSYLSIFYIGFYNNTAYLLDQNKNFIAIDLATGQERTIRVFSDVETNELYSRLYDAHFVLIQNSLFLRFQTILYDKDNNRIYTFYQYDLNKDQLIKNYSQETAGIIELNTTKQIPITNQNDVVKKYHLKYKPFNPLFDLHRFFFG